MKRLSMAVSLCLLFAAVATAVDRIVLTPRPSMQWEPVASRNAPEAIVRRAEAPPKMDGRLADPCL